MKNYHLWIIGCQYNKWDGARIKYALDYFDYDETKVDDAQIVIVLSCAVRQTAVNRIFGKIETWKDKKIIISGCVLDRDKRTLERKGATVIKWDDTGLLAKTLGITPIDKFKNMLNRGNAASSYVPIMTGCNNFCAYCAVPYTRGKETSRNADDVIREVKNLVSKGSKEIMLLGQNVNSYKFGFVKLLTDLDNLDGDFIISFTSNHPKDMSRGIVEAVSTLPKIKKEIHLPLQSGSDKILKAMSRPYTRAKYLKIVNMIKSVDPKIQITTDVIVGFPGETEADFQKTVEVFKKVKYHQAYINKYSPRPGTAAFALGDPIPWSEKQRRWHILNQCLNR